jgi:4-amino-4-deoxy-L-arabinose transferase-like glycosyltransferase
MPIHRLIFTIIIITWLGLGGLYAVFTPAWQAPDEPAHYNYVHYVAVHRSFPELTDNCYDQEYLTQLVAHRFPPEFPLADVCYEYHQPPLYYALAAPIFRLTGGTLLAMRLVSVLMGAGVVMLTFFIGRTVFPRQPVIALGGMAFVSLVPMHLTMLSAANNDVLAELIFATILLLLARRLASLGPTHPRWIITMGVALGLALITKVTIYSAVPLTLLALWWANRTDCVRFFRQTIIIFGLAAFIALPWYARNISLYGGLDVLGLGRHGDVVVGQLRTTDYWADVGGAGYARNFITTTFHSFWGQFGWMAVPMDSRTYLFLELLSLTAIGGLAARLWATRRQCPAPAPTLMIATLGLMIAGYGWYNFTFVQFQGRYLFPALIPLGLFFSMGLRVALSYRRRWLLAGWLTAALGWVAISGMWNGSPDKWAILGLGLLWIAALGRAGLGIEKLSADWLLGACYLALAGLAAAAPFWFIIPHLTP